MQTIVCWHGSEVPLSLALWGIGHRRKKGNRPDSSPDPSSGLENRGKSFRSASLLIVKLALKTRVKGLPLALPMNNPGLGQDCP
jgi:hypothetical protein